MKKYEIKDLNEAFDELRNLNSSNVVLVDFLETLRGEKKKRSESKFEKAPDSYLKKLKREDVFTRQLKEGEYGYYPGMYGLFEKKSGKLLRRHTDTGFLLIPEVKKLIGR